MFESHSEAIYELLRADGQIDPIQLKDLREEGWVAGRSLADIVIEGGWTEKPTLLAKVAGHLGCAFVADVPAVLTDSVATLLPGALARSYGLVPLRAAGHDLEVLATDPFASETAGELNFALGRTVRVLVGDPAKIATLIKRHYGEDEARPDEFLREIEAENFAGADETFTADDLKEMAGQTPIVHFVNLVLTQAIRDQASDIHFEPFEQEFKIRYRVDGALYEMTPPSKALALPITSRIKVLGNLDIAERRIPQDGRIRMSIASRAVDLRVSTLPTHFGESVVLRVLDQAAVQLDFETLGLPEDVRAGVQQVIRRPNGILLVTGPTGSGKTTTLYSGLRAINQPALKLLTIEDPVEYEIEGIMQVPINPAAGLTFASALRSFLRQDPDVIMIGEIRDLETAQIAIQASLTGHLVLSTLHTNDAVSAVTRLRDMGVAPFLLASTVEAVLAQRLVRRICPHCRTAGEPAPALLAHLDAAGAARVGNRPVFHGRGCAHCNGTGYRGRKGIFEWLVLSESLRELVAGGAPAPVIRQAARDSGTRSLRAEGIQAVLDGTTTLEEVVNHT